jgi:iron complex outermembrane receptor protein
VVAAWALAGSLAVAAFPAGASGDGVDSDDLRDLDLEELMAVRITSVAKKEQSVAEAPAAVYVITREEIARSGATSIPELLRRVPGMHVAQIDSHQWAISARGFNGLFANKLLVLIDGRSVYTPIFAGVYWDTQDTLLEDVERIEVIRGPGATLWGANAVNGVINITTRDARDTAGGWVTLGAGTEELAAGVRYGGAARAVGWRIYAKGFERDASRRPGGGDGFDDWSFGQAGFRVDAGAGSGTWTIQGDVYDGDKDQEVLVPVLAPPFEEVRRRRSTLAGANLVARWTRRWSEERQLEVQGYYDRVERHDVLFDLEQDVFDLDLQYRFRAAPRHDLVAGFGFRHLADELRPEIVSLVPPRRSYEILTGFVQDEIAVVPGRFSLVLGTKVEHNDFNGLEIQPNVRFLWTLAEGHSLWGSVSRAVRSSSRSEHDARADAAAFPGPGGLPIVARLTGSRDQDSEKLSAFELGYRRFASERFWFDLSLFFNDYRDLRTFEPGVPFFEPSPSPRLVLPLVVDDLAAGESFGAELALSAVLTDVWRLRAGYTYFDLDVAGEPGSNDPAAAAASGETPRHQLYLRSSMNLPRGVDLDATVRWIDEVPALAVDGYVELDLRLARRFGGVEASLVGRNLLAASHAEYVATIINSPRAEIERAVQARLGWRF